ncbi:MAG: hypothetical protein JOZ47_23025 [Kutzneria sp.]|nr:hypothetical protein [Kutzneria sp.]MBV9847915.1 hypothetical protein [Kutzneria sp.]
MTDIPVRSAARWLGALNVLLSLGFGLAVMSAAVGVVGNYAIAFHSVGISAGIDVSVPAPQPPLTGIVKPGADVLPHDITVTVRDPHHPTLTGALYFLTWFPGVLVGLLSLNWLAKAVHLGRRADRLLFSAEAVGLLTKAGWTLTLGSIVAAVLDSGATFVASAMMTPQGHPPYQRFTDGYVLLCVIGVAVLAASEIVRRGRRLLDDLEGVV